MMTESTAFDFFLPANYLIREECLGLRNEHYDSFFDITPIIEIHPWPTAICVDLQGSIVLWALSLSSCAQHVDMKQSGVRRTLTELADGGASADDYQLVRYWFMQPLV